MPAPRDRLLTLIKERAYIERELVLASGEKSSYYIDGKMVELHPEGAHLIGEVLLDEIGSLEFDAVGGIAVGAVPMVSSLVISCHHHQRPVEGFFVRSEIKKHGTQKSIEGKLEPGARAVILDDVITTGGSVIKAVEGAEAAGAKVVKVLSLVDRQQGARERFAGLGYDYASIFTKDDVVPRK